jgi:hypothetical protein
MHRSGTSLAARALELLGVSLGDPHRLMEPGPDNPSGYWENRAIKELDDELLACLGGAWDQPPVLDPGWELDPGLDGFREAARDALGAAFGPRDGTQSEPIGWKDPRLSLLLPFWRTVSPITTTVIVVRDPAEVGASLLRRNHIAAPQAALLWLRYLYAAVHNDAGHLLLRQRDFFDDLRPTLERMAAHIGLPAPTDAVEHDVRAHIDDELRHHVGAPATLAADNPLVALADAVWNRGAVDLDVLPPIVREALARGWIRSPVDGEELARARAQTVEMRERGRRQAVKVHALEDKIRALRDAVRRESPQDRDAMTETP